jgi:hypothetical protein
MMNFTQKPLIFFSVKPVNGIVITDELREELDQAALATQQAYLAVRAAPGKHFLLYKFCSSFTVLFKFS